MRHGLSLLVLLLLAAGCEDADSGYWPSADGSGPVVVFDLLARPLPEMPFPNDLATRLDLDSPTGRRVNASLAAATLLEQDVRREFNLLDGWGTFSPITVSFTGELDVRAIRDAHLDDDPSNDVAYVVDLATGTPVKLDLGRGNFPLTLQDTDKYFPNDPRRASSNLVLETYEERDLNGNGRLDPDEDTDGDGVWDHPNTYDPTKPLHGVNPDDRAPPGEEGNDVYRDLVTFYERESHTLIIRPTVPLEQATTYAVVLTKRLRSTDGTPVRSPFPFGHHAAQAEQMRTLAAHVATGKIGGLRTEDVAFAWTFTTQTITRDLESIREGLYGRGPLAWVGEKVGPRLETVQAIVDPSEGPTEHVAYPGMTAGKARELGYNLHVVPVPALKGFFRSFSDELGLGSGDELENFLSSFDFVDYLVFGAYRSPDFLDDPAIPMNDAVWHLNREAGLARLFERPEGWQDVEADALVADATFAADAAEQRRAAKRALRDRVAFVLAVPKKLYAKGDETFTTEVAGASLVHGPPFPVTIYGHGAGSSKLEMLPLVGHFAKFGIALVGIDSYAHGLDVEQALRSAAQGVLRSEGLDPLSRTLFVGRARDLNNDGIEDSGGDFWVADAFHVRDVVRQSIVDWMQLIRVFHAFGTYEMGDADGDGKPELAGDFNADGVVDVSGLNADGSARRSSDVYVLGGSLGGILSGVLPAVEPAIVAAAPIAGGAGLADIGMRTDLGGVVDNVFHDMMGPMIIGNPAPDGGVELSFQLNFVREAGTRRITGAPIPAAPGDLVEVVNLNTDEPEPKRDAIVVPADRRFRLHVAADNASFADDSPFQPGQVRVGACEEPSTLAAETTRLHLLHPADCLRIRVLRRSGGGWQEVYSMDRFGTDVEFKGRTYPSGSPLVSLGRGFGFKRGTKTFRRFLNIAQAIMDPADPANYARHFLDDPLPARAGRPVPTIFMPTIGDGGVPVHTGFAMARIAGVVRQEFDPVVDAPYGMSPNDLLIRTGSTEAVEKLRYALPAARRARDPEAAITADEERLVRVLRCDRPEHCEQASLVDVTGLALDPASDRYLDDTNRYLQGYGGVPRLKRPLRDAVTRHVPTRSPDGEAIDGIATMIVPYGDAHGRHGFDFPNPASDFDIGMFVFNQIGRYFQSRGSDVRYDPCMHRDGWDRRRSEEGATRVPACSFLPRLPTPVP